MSSTYKVLQSYDGTEKYTFKEKNNSYFDGLTWKKVEKSSCNKNILNDVPDITFQAERLGNILDYIYLNESSNNDIVNLTKFQFTNNYDVKPFHEYGIGDPNLINWCVSGNKNYYKPNTTGVINSDIFHYPETFIFEKSKPANPYYDCEIKALKSNVPYFVVGNISYSATEASYNCYIPKFKNAYNTNVIKKLIDPISETINNIFESGQKITNELLFEKYLDASQNNINDYYFKDSSYHAIPGKDNFLIYTTDSYNFSPNTNTNTNPLENIDKIREEINLVTSHKEYSELYYNSLNPNNMYKHFYNYTNTDHLTNYFYHFNCLDLPLDKTFATVKKDLDNLTNTGAENKFDKKIIKIYEQWKLLNDANHDIVEDISRINIIGKDREVYLSNLYKVIENEQNELKKLLNNANGGIGRLKDQKYLRDNTIVEINILILIIIFSLFLYSKIK